MSSALSFAYGFARFPVFRKEDPFCTAYCHADLAKLCCYHSLVILYTISLTGSIPHAILCTGIVVL